MRRVLSAALGVLLLSGAAAAQSAAAPGDPVSGAWTGYFLGGGERSPMTMELRLDEAGAVSGVVVGVDPGRIAAGSFDPVTGALHLEVDVGVEGQTRRFVLEATIVDDLTTGRVSSDGLAGAFRAARTPPAPRTPGPTVEASH